MSRRTQVEALEARAYLATSPVSLSETGFLSVSGTAGHDKVFVYSDKHDFSKLIIRRNGTDSSFNAGAVKTIKFNGGSGNDRFEAQQAMKAAVKLALYGEAGADTLIGADGNDTLVGAGGNDRLRAGVGNDYVYGNDGDDFADGGSGRDVMRSGNGTNVTDRDPADSPDQNPGPSDVTLDPAGILRIVGTDAADTILVAHDTPDPAKIVVTLNGAESRFVEADVRAIEINSGEGDDGIDMSTVTNNVPDYIALPATIYAGAGHDYVRSGTGTDVLFGGDGFDILLSFSGADSMYGGDGNDLINGGVQGTGYLDGESGDDNMAGGITMIGGSGDDKISASGKPCTVYGGDGDDTIELGNNQVWADGGAGDDYLRGSVLADVLYGGAGEDTLDGGSGDDTLYGEAGDDQLYGKTHKKGYPGHHDDPNAFSGDDVLYGGIGEDTLVGHDGDDIIDAGEDTVRDLLSGTSGNDQYVNQGEEDVIEVIQ